MKNIPSVGKPISRLEGHLKVTGSAKYAGEYEAPDLLYGYIVNSTITKGKIKSIDTEHVKKIEGVIEVFTHENKPSTAWFDFQYADMDAPPGIVFKPLKDNEIKYNGQPIALVVAETFEMARYAAAKINIVYEEENFETDLKTNLEKARDPKKGMASLLKPPPPKPNGDFQKEYDHSFVKTDSHFSHGTEHHNPMEMYASTVIYEGKNKLKIYDKTQGTINSQMYVANVFGLKMKNVQVISPFVGGGFGSGLRPQQQLFMAVMASLALKRNVRVTLSRAQMYMIGHRPPTLQHTKFGADKSGKVNAMYHKAIGETSRFEDYVEIVVNWANMLYPAENTLLEHQLVPLDVYSPLDMRAPGGSTGMHAIEVTMDEIAYQLNIDPLELRLINYSEIDKSSDKEYSSKELRKCYLKGAEKFGWNQRNPKPRSMKRGNKLVGYGMATGIWDANRIFGRAEAIMTSDGKVEVKSAVTDIGTGTFTIMTQIAADELGLPIEDVTFSYADSKMPFAPIQGGSFTTATVGPAVQAACQALNKKLFKKAKDLKNSVLGDTKFNQVTFKNGFTIHNDNPEIKVSISEIFEANEGKPIKTTNSAIPNPLTYGKKARAVHSAVFVEVEVDEELGVIEVRRALTAVAAGKIINPKTAESQVLGGMIWGLSKALHEETIVDHELGKYMNANLAEYHIPVHADIHDLQVLFIDEEDQFVNDLGVKGVGEIGGVGMPPAVTNAIFHATGKRIYDLPIHFDKLL
ncbi:xanthine dehydrogenase family protein molybdopterin-binding subunit [Chryseobacterium indoltheticum]|uniref:4-hydroxybenzoyl-CoA reductase subunit alpha n=1 Tax=Chryseobacterium indoltheticum TaxID=254 RepID=A0A381FEN6_9FLAO|nr:xanthine dehydrogenase family protein molybdopterin-binding subunit [Chryseobacterium indoltheticum]AZA74254.1 xanthine dehydrogenase family protein molybdopterin-binding subunit [Chryseobacterium indoltheticum]SIR34710.1 xanthine dehydrogenase, molybdenum binding subunit apoprotein [Chryseobacterium indoltheticum]SUX45015.1 4-hydroxybenzoyl-CoA reductase subunit alpha [Chryseobacterium indoltheticum]